MDEFALRNPMFVLIVGGPRVAIGGGSDSASTAPEIVRDRHGHVEHSDRVGADTFPMDLTCRGRL